MLRMLGRKEDKKTNGKKSFCQLKDIIFIFLPLKCSQHDNLIKQTTSLYSDVALKNHVLVIQNIEQENKVLSLRKKERIVPKSGSLLRAANKKTRLVTEKEKKKQ